MLEVIDRGSPTDAHPTPLLFVHGAWHAAWCWDDHFLGYFADRGYHAVALSLRGHGGSGTDKPLNDCSFDDYVADIATVAATLPTPPVIVAHSMGGFVAQHYLGSHRAPAAVLMASMPPTGYRGSGLRWLRTHPVLLAKMSITHRSLPYVGTPAMVRERFFCASTPQDIVTRCAERLGEESARTGRDGIRYLPRPERVTTPVLVLGAVEDGAVSNDEVRVTARAYHTDADFFPGMGHNMMLEPTWSAVADRIDAWLVERGL
jgi:pimeloyl-ACP methyl ester carboxylesterase